MCINRSLCVYVPCSVETQCYCFSQASQAEFYKPGIILQAQTSALAVERGLEPSKIRFPNSRMPIRERLSFHLTVSPAAANRLTAAAAYHPIALLLLLLPPLLAISLCSLSLSSSFPSNPSWADTDGDAYPLSTAARVVKCPAQL
jgi:hypothetical protein